MKIVRGPVVQSERPDWRPLRRIVPDVLVETFMWMFEVRLPGRRVHAYKHVVTRRYLFLSLDGAAYAYLDGDRYTRVPTANALELALAPWWEELGASPEETAAAWAALAAVRRSR